MAAGKGRKKKHWRTQRAEEEAAAAAEAEAAPESAALPTNGASLGAAIEQVRSALEPFQPPVRDKIVRAAKVTLR